MEVLEFQALPIEKDPALVGEHVQAVAPLGMLGPQTYLNDGRGVALHGHRSQLGRHYRAPLIPVHLLKAPLHIQTGALRIRTNEDELSQAVEGVLRVVKGDDMRVSENSGHPGRLIGHTILSGSPLEAQRFTADRLFVLPEAARVERPNVVEPCGEGGHFVGLVPWHLTNIVCPSRPRAPHLVV